jgi:hypothetical protein
MQKEMRYECHGEGCTEEIDEPMGCCDGRECGCMGMPVEPPYCGKCWEEMMNEAPIKQEARPKDEL